MVQHVEVPSLHSLECLSASADRAPWGGNSSGTSLRLSKWKQQDWGEGTWDIPIRSDNEGQSIYGPSLTLIEEKVDVSGLFGGTESVQLTALGRSKASNEFLVLHYFGLDSAKHRDALLTVLPVVRLPGVSARWASAVGMFEDSHIAPSHRRMAHVL